VPCPAGAYATAGAPQCSSCEPGFHAPNASSSVCLRCSPALHLNSSADRSACVCADTFVPNADGEEGCTCDRNQFLGDEGACAPCPGSLTKPSLGVDRSQCVYAGTETWPVLVAAAVGVLLVVAGASFALR
jgi:hypothetical protein